MAELIADLFVSLDGFAAGEDVGPYFGYGAPELDRWIDAEQNRPQVLLMGRVTYELMATITASADDEVSARMTATPKAVVSNSLAEPLAWANTRLLRGDPAESVAVLKQQSDVPVRSIGSVTLVRGLLRLGLVDQLRLAVFPITLGGDGREPAYLGYPRTGYRLVDTTVLDSQVVVLTYRPGA